MASQVDIVKLALGHVADAARVNSIDPPDSSNQAQLAAIYYPIAQDQVLEARNWDFATRRHVLVESLVEFEDGEWGFTYNMPSNYIRAIKVVPPGAPMDHPGYPFKIESDLSELDTILLTNVEDAILHYLYREEETGRYSPSFIVALSYLLGSYFAGPLIKGKNGMTVKRALKGEYKTALNEAGAHNANAQQDAHQWGGHTPTWVSDR
jgi:hypothetical protein